ncbi:MAG: LPD23 domain-containing protein [Bordetella sp.]
MTDPVTQQVIARARARVTPLPALGQSVPAPHNPLAQAEIAPISLGTRLENYSIGLGQGLADQGEGLYQMVTNPVQTARGLYELGKYAVTQPGEAAAQFGNYVKEGVTGGPLSLGQFIGENIGFGGRSRQPVRQDIYGGVKAKTADLDAWNRATALDAQGVPMDKIYENTGWFKGPGGDWRFEIDDSRSTYTKPNWGQEAYSRRLDEINAELKVLAKTIEDDLLPGGGFRRFKSEAGDAASKRYDELLAERAQLATNPRQGKVGDILSHEQLAEAYPELMGISVGELAPWSNYLGSYSNDIGGKIDLKLDSRPDKDVRETLIHELQHAIQAKEGFPRGGNPDLPEMGNVVNPAYQKYQKAIQESPEFRELLSLLKSQKYSQELQASNSLWATKYAPRLKADEQSNLRRGSVDREVATQLFDEYQKESKRIFPTLAKVDEISGSLKERGIPWWESPPEYLSAHQAYRLLAGEQEARSAQKRVDLPKEARKSLFPWESYDDPMSDMIVRR